MDEVVARLLGDAQTVLPLAERAQALGEDRLAVDAVDGQDLVVVAVRQDRVDEEVAGAARFRVLASSAENEEEGNW